MKGRIVIQNTANVIRAIQNQVAKADEMTLEVLKYAGETFVKNARENRQFQDDTGNLQSSIGYVIVKDRKIVFKALRGIGKSPTSKGTEAAERLAEAIMINLPKGFSLIGLAGMEYGIYVEAMGIDVITGSIPETQRLLKQIFKEIK